MSETKRYCLVVDDSSHWYCIPIELRATFDELDEQLSNDDGDGDAWGHWREYNFDAMRLGMHISNYSFSDWQEDRR